MRGPSERIVVVVCSLLLLLGPAAAFRAAGEPAVVIREPVADRICLEDAIRLRAKALCANGIEKWEIRRGDQLIETRATRDPGKVVGGAVPREIEIDQMVPLEPGENRIEVIAYAAGGAPGRATVLVRRHAPEGRIRAAVIGVGDYKNVRDLDYAVADAQLFQEYLTGHLGVDPADVHPLYDRAVTVQSLKTLLGTTLRKAADPADTIIIYYAGHGGVENLAASPDGDGLEKYLLPHDAVPDDLFATALAWKTIQEIFDRYEAERVIFIADACYSGAAGGRTVPTKRRATIAETFFDRLAQAKGRLVLTACGANETAGEDAKLGHGIFTHHLVEALKGKGDGDGDGIVTADEAYAYVVGTVPKASGRSQHPVKSGKVEGLLVLGHTGSPKAEARPVEPKPGPKPAEPGPSPELQALGPNAQGYEEFRRVKDGAVMVLIPEGSFSMGAIGYSDEQPVHTVTLSAYLIDKYEVTWRQYLAFCAETGREGPPTPDWGIHDDHPVVNVSWHDALAYAQWAGGALPTEAQWEMATRGRDGRTYPWGKAAPDAGNCWSSRTSGDKTHPVTSLPAGASPYGLMHMAGNVWEWCADWYGKDYYGGSPPRDPTGPASGTERLLRGGSWGNVDSTTFRAAHRYRSEPINVNATRGFRVARSAGPPR